MEKMTIDNRSSNNPIENLQPEVGMESEKKAFGIAPVTLVILLGAFAKFAAHILTGTSYGYMSDELYTIALSKHLAFGYVDVPPLAPLIMAAGRLLFGESLLAIHILPALAGAGTLVFACLIAREFGGKTFAVGLTALGFLIVPVWLTFDSVFTYDCIDQLVLAAFLFTLVRYLRTGDRRLWILLGTLAGIACLTKMTLPILGPGFLIALLISKHRKDLLSPWPWLGGLVFLFLLSPYVLWEAANHWATLTYWSNYGSQRLYEATWQEYFANVFFSMNPVLLPLIAIGLYRIFRRLGGRNYYFLGIMFLLSLAVDYLLHARTWMLAEMFLPLLAAGSVCLEEIADGRRWGAILRPAAVVAALAGGILVAPANLPIVPVKDLPAYAQNFEFLYRPIRNFIGTSTEYPEYFSLRFGWEDLVREVAKVYDDLPPQDRRTAGIYANWYAPAAAIDLLGPAYGLPPAVSGHLTYYLWGPGESSWDVMIIVTRKTNDMAPFFETCERKAAVHNDYSAASFNQLSIFVCRDPKVSPQAIWGSVEEYK
jgi:hypothetical protein